VGRRRQGAPARALRTDARGGAPLARAGSAGPVVCTASTSGILGNFGQSNYGAAKAGIAAFAQIVAQETWKHGITVNAICPAARTRMTEGAYGDRISA
jgi:NAD(P)-dependent dehydrogenase (short-subunit alcohol dehydrogenase family)